MRWTLATRTRICRPRFRPIAEIDTVPLRGLARRDIYPTMIWSQTTIVRIASALLAVLAGCDSSAPTSSKDPAPGVLLLSSISDLKITESSGIIASRRFADVYWTHNDGGGPKKQVLYAIDRQGKTLASFPVVGATFRD